MNRDPRPAEPEPRSAVPLARRFVASVRQSAPLPPDSRVVVALSGGLDSVVLLDLLLETASELRVSVAAAHFDHGMREGSRADARWVAQECERLDVPLVSGVARVRPASEAEARDARYRFLSRARRRLDADRIATAHHADDQVETVLFRLARGTGPRGMAGIPTRRGAVIRPLLPFRRSELRAHAGLRGLAFREDPSNGDRRFARNRLRHEALPRLRRDGPDAEAALLELAAVARAAERGWQELLAGLEDRVLRSADDGSFTLALPLLRSYHPHVRARVLRRVLRRLGSTPDRAGTRAALAFISSGSSGRWIPLAGGVRLEREFDCLRVRREPDVASEECPLRIETYEGVGRARVGGRRLDVRWSTGGGGGTIGVAEFAASAVRLPLELRAWKPGERVAMPYGTKKLKKLLAERRLGPRERRRVAVLVDGQDRVLWVEGLARRVGTEPAPGETVFRVHVTDAEFG